MKPTWRTCRVNGRVNGTLINTTWTINPYTEVLDDLNLEDDSEFWDDDDYGYCDNCNGEGGWEYWVESEDATQGGFNEWQTCSVCEGSG